MLKIGAAIRRTDTSELGTIDKTSTKSGQKLYRVNDAWLPRSAIEPAGNL